jgi:hypothetical protein
MEKKNSKQSMQKVAKQIRAKSETLNDHKASLADAFIDGFDEGISEFGKTIDVLEGVVSIYRNVQRLATSVAKDKGVRTKFKSLVENVIGDFTTRMNEFSGIVDYVSKSETLVKEFDSFSDNIKNVENKINGVKKGRKGKFTVVTEESELQ